MALDDGTAVVDETEVVIEPGERLLVAGESGTGKSTLVRALAGLWPWGGGSVNFHPDRRLFMLPQKPYIPSGTLRRAIAYPGAAENWTIKEIGDALHKVGLDHLKEKVEEEAPWDQILSGGEKQRLAFARVLLHNPDIVHRAATMGGHGHSSSEFRAGSRRVTAATHGPCQSTFNEEKDVRNCFEVEAADRRAQAGRFRESMVLQCKNGPMVHFRLMGSWNCQHDAAFRIVDSRRS